METKWVVRSAGNYIWPNNNLAANSFGIETAKMQYVLKNNKTITAVYGLYYGKHLNRNYVIIVESLGAKNEN